ncbi:MAG: hypothetical protein ABFC96_05745 [Thermoguttaceae bacterium]
MIEAVRWLRFLSIAHYVGAGLAAIVSCVPLKYLGLGMLLIVSPESRHGDMDLVVGIFFVACAGILVAASWGFAIGALFVGKNLAARRRYVFCLSIEVLLCLFIPLGTILGIFTIVMLNRPGVNVLFEQPPSPSP